MLKPTLHDFGLSEADYRSYIEAPKKVESRLMLLGAILGAILGFFLSFGRTTLTEALGIAFGGYVLGSIILGILSVALRDFFLRRQKSHSRASQYQAALLAYQRTQEDFWKSLDGREFERQLGQLFSLQGYRVEFTPATGDQGIDLVIVKDAIKTIVQCKSHLKPVSPSVVRDLYGALVASRAHSAILASTSGFTKGVYNFSKGKRIELLSLQEIIRLSEDVGHAQTIGSIQASS